ncbi:MAG: 8-amino-7-oxononanoate synthase [Burkholderiales bacterium]
MPDLSPQLEELARAGLGRRRRVVESADGPHLTVEGRRYLAFCSNDYLGLAHHPALVEAACRGAERYGVGAGASALISGHTEAHEALEARLARFVRLPRALHFGSGYLANLGVVAALAGRGATLFSDELNHACLIDAARLSRAEVRVYPHLDLAVLARMLERCETPGKLVATDAVFSMDGDLAPLPELLALCERHDAWLVVDDAHGFGVLGEGGRGALSHFGIAAPRIAYMGTLGKAAGVHGAFVAGEEALIEWLVQRARTYVFTTASPPLLACALMASLELIEAEEHRRTRLRELIQRVKTSLGGLPWRLGVSETPIQPLIVGDNRAAVELAEGLRERGIWVPAIRPPTVPAGSARLRIALSAAHGAEHIDELAAALHQLARRL